MKRPDIHEAEQQALTNLRRQIGCSVIYSEDYSRRYCEIIYGRSIHDRTWLRWKRRVRAQADPACLDGLSEASHLLLTTLARLLRGNGKSRTQHAPLSRLCTAATAALNGKALGVLPLLLSYAELRELAELQALKPYTDSYHRLRGLKKTKTHYSQLEAKQILSRYPDYSTVCQAQSAV